MSTYNLMVKNKNTITAQAIKVGLILTALVLPHIVLKILGINLDVNPFVLTGALFTGFILFLLLAYKALKNPIIPYILLQFIFLWIFLAAKILSPAGLNFKPHAVVFLLAVLTSGYFLVTRFKELWEYRPVRLLFIFFLISTVYAFFYKTDFRSSNYIDLWIQNNLGLRFSALQSGGAAITRAFTGSETQFLVYMTGLVPLISFLAGYATFWRTKGADEVKNKLYVLAGFSALSIFSFNLLQAIAVMAGTAAVMFMDGRLAIDGGFVGGDFTAVFLMVMVAFYFLISAQYKDFRFYNAVRALIITNMAVLSLLILLGIKKGTIISLVAAGIIVFTLVHLAKKVTGTRLVENFSFNFAVLVPVFLLVPVLLIGGGFVENLMTSIGERFSSNSTLDVRMVNWQMYIAHWLNNLDIKTFIFGFGIDSSREATFFLTAMHPDPSYQQPHIHNIYLEMFYNYGLMALFYFLPLMYILWRNIKGLFSAVAEHGVKIINALAIGVLCFYFIFDMAESPSMTGLIVTFALLGFIESFRGVGYETKTKSTVSY